MAERETITYEEKHSNYDKYFDPEKYLSYLPFSGSWEKPNYELDDISHSCRFKVRSMKNFIDYALQSKTGDVKTLDISTGSYIGSQLYLSGNNKVSKMICSDYLQANIDYLNAFLDPKTATSCSFDWAKFSQWAFGTTDLIDSFRQKCFKIEHIDMSNVESFKKLEEDGPFQIITSEWAFCEGAPDLDHYEKMLEVCRSLLEVGGDLILMDLVNQSFWVPDASNPAIRCPTVQVSLQWIRAALERNGFKLQQVDMKFCDNSASELFDSEGQFTIWATKFS